MPRSIGLLPASPLVVALLIASCAAQPPATTSPTAPGEPPPAVATVPSPPSATPPPPTQTVPIDVVVDAREILGVWALTTSNFALFAADGTLKQGSAIDGLDSAPYAVSTFRFSGSQMLVKEIEVHGVPPCGAAIGKYLVRHPSPDVLTIDVISDKCEPRARELAGEYTRVR